MSDKGYKTKNLLDNQLKRGSLSAVDQKKFELEKLPIPSLAYMIKELKDLSREKLMYQIEHEYETKQICDLDYELEHVVSILKLVEVGSLEIDENICQQPNQNNDLMNLKKEIEKLENELLASEEKTRVAIDYERKRAANAIQNDEHFIDQEMKEEIIMAERKKVELTDDIDWKKREIAKKMAEKQHEHEKRKEDIQKRTAHQLRVKILNAHVECKAKEMDLLKRISLLEKDYAGLVNLRLPKGIPSRVKFDGKQISKQKHSLNSAMPHPALAISSLSNPGVNHSRKRKLFQRSDNNYPNLSKVRESSDADKT